MIRPVELTIDNDLLLGITSAIPCPEWIDEITFNEAIEEVRAALQKLPIDIQIKSKRAKIDEQVCKPIRAQVEKHPEIDTKRFDDENIAIIRKYIGFYLLLLAGMSRHDEYPEFLRSVVRNKDKLSLDGLRKLGFPAIEATIRRAITAYSPDYPQRVFAYKYLLQFLNREIRNNLGIETSVNYSKKFWEAIKGQSHKSDLDPLILTKQGPTGRDVFRTVNHLNTAVARHVDHLRQKLTFTSGAIEQLTSQAVELQRQISAMEENSDFREWKESIDTVEEGYREMQRGLDKILSKSPEVTRTLRVADNRHKAALQALKRNASPEFIETLELYNRRSALLEKIEGHRANTVQLESEIDKFINFPGLADLPINIDECLAADTDDAEVDNDGMDDHDDEDGDNAEEEEEDDDEVDSDIRITEVEFPKIQKLHNSVGNTVAVEVTRTNATALTKGLHQNSLQTGDIIFLLIERVAGDLCLTGKFASMPIRSEHLLKILRLRLCQGRIDPGTIRKPQAAPAV